MPQVTLVSSRDANAPRKVKSRVAVPAARDSIPDTPYQVVDRMLHATVSRATGGLSPAALAGAFFDWSVHLTFSPGQQLDLARQAIAGAISDFAFAAQAAVGSSGDPCEHALPHDSRFRAPAWQALPFNIYAHNFLSVERWWEAATTNARGVSQRHSEMATFTARQILDTIAPSNFILSEPAARLVELDRGREGCRNRRAAGGVGGIQGR
jgi:polyhydroxyalkanoate synthase